MEWNRTDADRRGKESNCDGKAVERTEMEKQGNELRRKRNTKKRFALAMSGLDLLWNRFDSESEGNALTHFALQAEMH